MLKGVVGSDVTEWQQILIAGGYDVADDGHFGPATHNATLSWQKERGLKADGIVGPQTLAAINNAKISLPDPLKEELNITFKQAKNYTPANRTDIRWIVLHSMEAAEASTTAENVANWFASNNAPRASAHFNIDVDSIVQSCHEIDIAWHCGGGNKYGIGLEHSGYAKQTRAQWLDPYSKTMLKRSAKLSAYLCKKWNIPAVFVDQNALKRGEKGITTHYEVSKAFKKSDHWDPGPNFPMDLYLKWINELI